MEKTSREVIIFYEFSSCRRLQVRNHLSLSGLYNNTDSFMIPPYIRIQRNSSSQADKTMTEKYMKNTLKTIQIFPFTNQ